MTPGHVIDLVLGHTANDYIPRQCKAAHTDADAAAFLKRHLIPSGYCGPAGAWRADRKGVAYAQPGDPNPMPRLEDGYPLITWLEIARTARRSGQQLTLEMAT